MVKKKNQPKSAQNLVHGGQDRFTVQPENFHNFRIKTIKIRVSQFSLLALKFAGKWIVIFRCAVHENLKNIFVPSFRDASQDELMCSCYDRTGHNKSMVPGHVFHWSPPFDLGNLPVDVHDLCVRTLPEHSYFSHSVSKNLSEIFMLTAVCRTSRCCYHDFSNTEITRRSPLQKSEVWFPSTFSWPSYLKTWGSLVRTERVAEKNCSIKYFKEGGNEQRDKPKDTTTQTRQQMLVVKT